MVLQRTVPYGGDAAVETLLESGDADGIGYAKAVEILRKKPCIRLTTDPEAIEDADGSDEEIKQLRLDVTESLGMLSKGFWCDRFYNSSSRIRLNKSIEGMQRILSFAGIMSAEWCE